MSKTSAGIVYLNGDYIDLQDAKISVLDRGFLFGDSVYEVIPVYNNRPFSADLHLERLTKSLAVLQMQQPMETEQWMEIFNYVLSCSSLADKMLYIQVTRGVSPFRTHAIPADISPTIFVAALPVTRNPEIKNGITAITVKDQRWLNCRVKATTLLPNVLAKNAAEYEATHDAIFIREGYALEGTASNLFIVKNNKVITPPLSANILPGITRRIVINLLKSHHIDVEERMITTDELGKADEVWLTGSVLEIAPVILLDHCAVAEGHVGPMWKRIARLYADNIERTLS